MALNSEMTEYSMSLCAALAAREVAAATGATPTEALGSLLASSTGDWLYDDSLKLWWDGPLCVAVAYLQEKGLPIPHEWVSKS